ncbi:MAG: creatininase family protein [Pseudomonadota bacterium]
MKLPCLWQDLTTTDFTQLDFAHTVAVLPVAAIEQHGPHLPVATDLILNEGVLDRAWARLPASSSVLRLPTQAIGKSNEHNSFPGTLSLSTETVSRLWREIGVSVRRAGIRKLLLFNSHGGQPQIGELLARDLRVEMQMSVAFANWFDFGLPPGLIEEDEAVFGIHGGQIETSMMLALRPDLVTPSAAKDFVSSTVTDFQGSPRLLNLGANAYGWQAEDLNIEGAVGNAELATAEIGERLLDHAASALAELLLEIIELPLHLLMKQPRLEV